jgi:hypothetical protein
MPEPDESPAGKPTRWIGSSPVPENDRDRERRRRFADDTQDLPIVEEPAPQIQYVPVPVPVPYQPPVHPHGRPPKRRVWPWLLLLSLIACLGCCGGCAAWVLPYFQQYPATALTTANVPGLTIVEDAALTTEARALRRDSVESDQLGEQRFAVIYADTARRQQRVVLFGATRFIGKTAEDLDVALDRLGASVPLTGRREVDPGGLDGEQRCASGRFRNAPAAMCAWADHGSIGVVLFPGREVDASAILLQEIRAAVIKRH